MAAKSRSTPHTKEATAPSSRLCFKNLPTYATSEKLRQHIEKCGAFNLTDVNVVKRRDGVSRRFAFVGFKTIEDAARARKFFDKTFFNTSRLKVEDAQPVGAKTLARAWSRHTAGSSAYDRIHGTVNGKVVQTEEKINVSEKSNNPEKEDAQSKQKKEKFNEFLNVMKPRSKGEKWANDAVVQEVSVPVEKNDAGPRESDSSGSSDDEEYDDPKPRFHRSDDDNSGESSSSSDSDDDKQDPSSMSDMEFLRSKVSSSDLVAASNPKEKAERSSSVSSSSSDSDSSDSDSDSDSPSPDDGEAVDRETAKEADDLPVDQTASYMKNIESAESVEDSGRLFVRNLPFSTTEDDLRELFQAHGALTEVHIPMDGNNKSRGFAYITFVVPECAVMALTTLDGNIFQGRLIHILPARKARDSNTNREDSEDEIDGGNKSSFKKKQQEEAKRAANDDANWNPIYIRSEAVVGALAERFNMKKGDILDSESSNMAVRVALGEAHIIEETKTFLTDHGVSTEALDQAGRGRKVRRSKNVILVKNLPADTDVPELRSMFTKHGEIVRFVVPPSKVMALVEYIDQPRAKRAFSSLAYKRYKRVPLYLEWAPEGSFAAPTPAQNPSSEGVDGVQQQQEELSNSIFVKNLSFDTTEEVLEAHFQKVVKVRAVKIPRKGAGTKNNSMGFGFIELCSITDARKAMKALQGSFLEGHTLDLKLSETKMADTSVKGGVKRKQNHAKNPKGTKLAIKNLAFEATRDDLRELFGAFGQIKSVRIPRKFDGSHRGFGFVDFLTHEEALNSLTSLSSAHLYGRHLVVNWAEEQADEEKDEEAELDGRSSKRVKTQ